MAPGRIALGVLITALLLAAAVVVLFFGVVPGLATKHEIAPTVYARLGLIVVGFGAMIAGLWMGLARLPP